MLKQFVEKVFQLEIIEKKPEETKLIRKKSPKKTISTKLTKHLDMLVFRSSASLQADGKLLKLSQFSDNIKQIRPLCYR